MSREKKGGLRYHIGTLGYFVIILGVLGGPVLGWWLIFEGDIIAIIHEVKMGLPGWAWVALKYGLSIAVALMLMGGMVLAGMSMLWWGSRK
jgi:hypothetical protein